jgi:hypothetical protein
MVQRVFLIAIGLTVCVLLLALVMESAGIRRSLRRIEREQRELISAKFRFLADTSADALWQNASDGTWILVPTGPCSSCREPFYHRFYTKAGCEGALAEWNAALNDAPVRRTTGPILESGIGVLGKCEVHPLRR